MFLFVFLGGSARWKMSKNLITIVLIVIMIVGNVAASGKRTPEIWRSPASIDRTALEAVVSGTCDEYYDSLILQARFNAAEEKRAVLSTAIALIELVTARLDAILNAVPPPTPAEVRQARSDARDAALAIQNAAQALCDLIDAALEAAIAALELLKAICKAVYPATIASRASHLDARTTAFANRSFRWECRQLDATCFAGYTNPARLVIDAVYSF